MACNLFLVISVLTIVTFTCIYISSAIPFIVLHGISDQCSHEGVQNVTLQLIDLSKTEGYCIEVGDGTWDSWFMPMHQQVDEVCEKVKQMDALQQGYNLVGISQGNLVGRGLLEFCDYGPPVKNFISLGGPHAGMASVPTCMGVFCVIADNLIKSGVYTDYVQAHLAPSGYLKLPNDIPPYLQNCTFLPKLNNELPGNRNSTYKERFTSLENLVLVMFENDTVLIPKETSWFGYYPDGAFSPIVPAKQTKLYTEDWIGLKTLDDAGKVKFISVPGKHVQITPDEMIEYVIPYLVDETSRKGRVQRVDASDPNRN